MPLKKALTTAALLGSLFTASSVFAHAHLKDRTPAADSTVAWFFSASNPVNAHHIPGRPGLRLLEQGQSAELGFSLHYRKLD